MSDFEYFKNTYGGGYPGFKLNQNQDKNQNQYQKRFELNHGTNIPQESIIHIFDPFYRGDDSRIQYKNGTGLGLTIVKQILEQHQSNFSLYNINNDEEYAVCFEFTLRKAQEKDNNGN